MRKIWLLTIAVFFLTVSETLAAGFNLKSIGNVSTDGKQISHWWVPERHCRQWEQPG
jgi:hypothetical protein